MGKAAGMVGSELLELAEQQLANTPADGAEIVIWRRNLFVTRFATNTIHQNVAETDFFVSARIWAGKRVGSAVANQATPDGLNSLMREALEAANASAENPEFNGFPQPKALPSVKSYFEEVEALDETRRAELVSRGIDAARKAGLEAAGSLTVETGELCVVNSQGVKCASPYSSVSYKIIVRGGRLEGMGWTASRDPSRLDFEGAVEEAICSCSNSLPAVELEPGAYPVILGPAAVADMLFMLGWMGLGALAYQEGRSFATGRIGERVCSEEITVRDNALDPENMPFPFDFEGVPKQRVELISRGVLKGVVYDSFTAGREAGKCSTGHALPVPNEYGPLPTNLEMEAGEFSLDDLIETVDRGIYITRFHYTNVVDQLKTVITGMTRSGTFLVCRGQIANPIVNLRFTEPVLDVLSRVEGVSRTRRLVVTEDGESALVPALKLSHFNFG